MIETIREALMMCSSRQEGELRRSAADSDNAIAEMDILSLLMLISESIRFWNEDLQVIDIPIDQLLGGIDDVVTEYEESKGCSITALLELNQ